MSGVTLTFFASLYEPRGMLVRTSWHAFAERCETPRAALGKDYVPRWSPATFRGNRRALANVLRVVAAVYDFDRDGVQRVADVFADFFGLVHTTWSNTPTSPRSRLVLPISRSVSSAEYGRVWRYGAAIAERAGLAPDFAARDASRVWATPSMPKGAPYAIRHISGAFLNVAQALGAFPEEKPLAPIGPIASEDVAHRVMRARRYVDQCDPAIQGSNGSRACFKVALTLTRGFMLPQEQALELLAEYNERCLPPFSRRDLEHKIKDAATRSRVAPGWLANNRRSA